MSTPNDDNEDDVVHHDEAWGLVLPPSWYIMTARPSSPWPNGILMHKSECSITDATGRNDKKKQYLGQNKADHIVAV